jgi:hypothetical protein
LLNYFNANVDAAIPTPPRRDPDDFEFEGRISTMLAGHNDDVAAMSREGVPLNARYLIPKEISLTQQAKDFLENALQRVSNDRDWQRQSGPNSLQNMQRLKFVHETVGE